VYLVFSAWYLYFCTLHTKLLWDEEEISNVSTMNTTGNTTVTRNDDMKIMKDNFVIRVSFELRLFLVIGVCFEFEMCFRH
jgi:hypothetical protein